MRITSTAGGLRLDLEIAEAGILAQLLAEVDSVLAPDDAAPAEDAGASVTGALAPDAAAAARERLFPAAYRDDPEAQRGFADITAEAQRRDRSERVEQCLGELADATPRRRGVRLELDEEALQRWLRALNDVRLTLGTVLEVTEEDDWDFDRLDPAAGPEARRRATYLWLTAVQDGMVRAAMGD